MNDGPLQAAGSLKDIRARDGHDQEIILGRSAEIHQVVECWKGRRLSILHGDAGVGKTSLLRAGVVPMLQAAGVHVLSVGQVIQRSVFPVAALPSRNRFSFALLSSWYDSESPARISECTVAGFLRRHGRTDRFGQPLPILGAIDQAELLVRESGRDERYRLQFLDELAGAMDELPGLHLLLVVRQDALDETLALAERLSPKPPAICVLGSLTEETAREAVVGAWQAHEHTAQLLVDELRAFRVSDRSLPQHTPFVEPALLRGVLARLDEELLRDADMSAERMHLEVEQALADFCALALTTIAADYSIPPRDMFSWFRSVFGGSQGRAGVSEEAALTKRITIAVVRAVVDAHLIKVWLRDGSRYYEPQHSRLVETIDRLGDTVVPIHRPPPPERLQQAASALANGEFALACRHAEAAIRSCRMGDLRFPAEATSFLGNVAYERDDVENAIKRYREAAETFEAIPDNAAVGWLLAGIGRLLLETDPAQSVPELQAAASRLPHEVSIQTALGYALWRSGRTRAALAVLDGALSCDGDMSETERVRAEILADLRPAGAPEQRS